MICHWIICNQGREWVTRLTYNSKQHSAIRSLQEQGIAIPVPDADVAFAIRDSPLRIQAYIARHRETLSQENQPCSSTDSSSESSPGS